MIVKYLVTFYKTFMYLTLIQSHVNGEHCTNVVRLADLEKLIQNQKETIDNMKQMMGKQQKTIDDLKKTLEDQKKVISKITNQTGIPYFLCFPIFNETFCSCFIS